MKHALWLCGLFALTACATDHEFRVASVGDANDAALAPSGEASAPPLIVAGGPVLLGVPGLVGVPGGPAPSAGQSPTLQPPAVVGSVTALLPATGQAIVQLADGTSLLVNSATATVGQTVSLTHAGALAGTARTTSSTLLSGTGGLTGTSPTRTVTTVTQPVSALPPSAPVTTVTQPLIKGLCC